MKAEQQQSNGYMRRSRSQNSEPTLFILEELNERFQREGSYAIPSEILEQKHLLHTGLVMVSQGHLESAKVCFIKCINLGKTYDPRIRLECAI